MEKEKKVRSKMWLLADAAVEKRIEHDWVGNVAAFTCILCRRVFIVSASMHRDGRACPGCQRCEGHVTGGRNMGGEAFLLIAEEEPQHPPAN